MGQSPLTQALANQATESKVIFQAAQLGASGNLDFTREDVVNEAVKFMRKNTCKGCTDAEIGLALYICAKHGFDPMMRELYYIPGQGPVVSRDARLRKATEQADYAGLDSLPVRAEDGKLLGWRCVGYKWRGDNRVAVVTIEHSLDMWRKARWSEGMNNEEAMIQKVTEERLFERMYPISGLRTDTQMVPAAQLNKQVSGLTAAIKEAGA